MESCRTCRRTCSRRLVRNVLCSPSLSCSYLIVLFLGCRKSRRHAVYYSRSHFPAPSTPPDYYFSCSRLTAPRARHRRKLHPARHRCLHDLADCSAADAEQARRETPVVFRERYECDNDFGITEHQQYRSHNWRLDVCFVYPASCESDECSIPIEPMSRRKLYTCHLDCTGERQRYVLNSFR